jgi:murein DD-endopeptidase MepM/ murein hydrolase activator NlpD
MDLKITFSLIVFLFNQTQIFAQDKNTKIDSLVMESLIGANDTTKVYKIKSILGNRYNVYQKRFEFIPSINPLNPKKLKRISSKFGKRFHPIDNKTKRHLGIDISSKKGTAIHASAAGTVIEVIISNDGYGNQVIIKHDYGFTTRYAHMHSSIVSEGEAIKKGKIIGFVGNSGKSNGHHLHYEILKYNLAIDPYPFCFLNLDQ